jgi:transposase
MTQQKPRKPRTTFTIEQKLDYAKLMVNENYINKQIMEISGAGPTAVTRWKKQYLAELNGQTLDHGKANDDRTTRNTIFKETSSMVKVVLGFLGFYCVMINLLILYYKAINVSKIVRSLHFAPSPKKDY